MVVVEVDVKVRLACVHEHIKLADAEHAAFVDIFVVSLACLVVVPVCGAPMVVWCCWTNTKEVALKTTDTCNEIVKCDDVLVYRCIIMKVMLDVITSLNLMDTCDDGRVTGKLLALPPSVTMDDGARG